MFICLYQEVQIDLNHRSSAQHLIQRAVSFPSATNCILEPCTVITMLPGLLSTCLSTVFKQLIFLSCRNPAYRELEINFLLHLFGLRQSNMLIPLPKQCNLPFMAVFQDREDQLITFIPTIISHWSHFEIFKEESLLPN